MRRQNLQSPMQFLMDYLRSNLLLNSSVTDLYVSRRKASRVSSGSKDCSWLPSRNRATRYAQTPIARAWRAVRKRSRQGNSQQRTKQLQRVACHAPEFVGPHGRT